MTPRGGSGAACEPGLLGPRAEHDRHAVVDVARCARNASVVTIEQLRSCEPSGRRQVAHSPAKANGSPSARVIHSGCFAAVRPLLPLVEAVGDDQAAPRANASRKPRAARSIVSARALIILSPSFSSLAQCGTRPQRSSSPRGSPSLVGRDREDVVAGRDVEALADLDRLADREAGAQLGRVGAREREAPAHQPARCAAPAPRLRLSAAPEQGEDAERDHHHEQAEDQAGAECRRRRTAAR